MSDRSVRKFWGTEKVGSLHATLDVLTATGNGTDLVHPASIRALVAR